MIRHIDYGFLSQDRSMVLSSLIDKLQINNSKATMKPLTYNTWFETKYLKSFEG